MPAIERTGLPVLGGSLELRVAGGAPGAFGVMAFAPQAAPLFLGTIGGTFYAGDPRFAASFQLDAQGTSRILYDRSPIPASLCGVQFVCQAYVLDPAAQGGVALTAALVVQFGAPLGPLFPVAIHATGDFPTRLAARDLSGDGVDDVAVATRLPSAVHVHLGDGFGGLSPSTGFSVGDFPVDIAVADFSGDGVPDLATANDSGDASVLLGAGGGAFQPAVEYPVGDSPSGIEAGDLNGDGVDDLAFADEDPDTLVVLLSSGSGTFGAPQAFATGSTPGFLALADLDGDGDLDAGTANFSSDDVTILLGAGDGTFGPKTSYPGAPLPRGLAFADLDLDGIQDLVVLDDASDVVLTRLGIGNGSFGPLTTVASVAAPASVEIDDVDGDLVPDLLVCSATPTGQVAVLIGLGGGASRLPTRPWGRLPETSRRPTWTSTVSATWSSSKPAARAKESWSCSERGAGASPPTSNTSSTPLLAPSPRPI